MKLEEMIDYLKTVPARGPCVLLKNAEGQSPLHLAVIEQNKMVVETVLQLPINYSAVNNADQTALDLAITMNNFDLVIALADKVDLTRRNKRGDTPLHLAALYGDESIARYLFNKKPECADYRNQKSYSPLYYALMQSDEKMVEFFLSRTQTLLRMSSQESIITPLYAAVYYGDSACFNLLVRANVPLNVKNKEGDTALHRAAELGAIDILKILISAGANLDCQNNKGLTPLHLAILSGRSAAVEMLVSQQANLNIQNNEGDTALHLVIRSRAPLIFSSIFSYRSSYINYAVMDLLLNARADLTVKNNQKKTALCLAIAEKNYPVVSKLIQATAPIHFTNQAGEPIFYDVLRTNHVDMIKIFIEAGALRHVFEPPSGLTPLILASLSSVDDLTHQCPPPAFFMILVLLVQAGERLDKQTLNRAVMPATYKNELPMPISLSKMQDISYLENSLYPVYQGDTALHVLTKTYFGDHDFLLKLIKSHEADVNIANTLGFTPLHYAVLSSNLTLISVLLAAGADANRLTLKGETALHLAAMRCDRKVIETILATGVFVDIKTTYGLTAAHLVVQNRLGDKKESMELLLNHTVRLDIPDDQGLTVFMLASFLPEGNDLKNLILSRVGCTYSERALPSSSF